ncbi:MAG: hypothetical protein ACXAE3_03925 [Candidatus Kariarchaeaceae archaeon]|jgi:hypothetical protein
MDDIPVGFFTLPSMEYLAQEPPDPYNYPTTGLLHSSKFVQILDALMNERRPNLEYILDGHGLQKELERLDEDQISDFCRHILVINRDKIGWGVVDKYLVMLSRHAGLAGWEKVELLFVEEVKILFSGLIKWETTGYHSELIRQFVEQSPVLSIARGRILENLTNDYKFWKMRDLWLLFEDLIDLRRDDLGRFQKYEPILVVLLNIFESELKEAQDNPSKRVILLTLLTRGLVTLGYDRIGEVFDLTSRIWIDLEHKYSDLELKSYRYLVAIIFAKIGLEYYKYNISFVHNRQLVMRLLASYFTFDDISLEELFDNILKSDTDYLLKVYLWNGFSAMEQLLREYMLELMESSEKAEITELLYQLSSILYKGAISLLEEDKPADAVLVEYLEIRSKKEPEFRKACRTLIEIIQNSYHGMVLLQRSRNTWEEFSFIAKLTELKPNSIENNLFLKHLELLADWTPITELVERIQEESGKTGSIVNSSTFEREFIIMASEIMDLVKKVYNRTGSLPIHLLEQLFFYLVSWLEIFQNGTTVYQDFLLIISPIISIIHVHIIQAYYERNQHALAFVEYINFQYMASVFRSQMDLIGISEDDITTEYLADEYRSMVKDWDIAQRMTIEALNKSMKSIELKFINQKQETTGMIGDEILIGFFELAQNMELIIESGIDGIKFYTLADQFYHASEPTGHIYTHIGEHTGNTLRIPLFSNPRQYNAAVSVIPFNVDLSGKMVELDLDSLLQYFEIKGDDN